jgi:hypothetical protein
MMYLICPERVILWIDLGAPVCFEAVEMGLDLGRLSWRPSRLPWDKSTLPLALAHGAPCSAGIIVPAEIYGSVDRARKLQNFYLRLRQSPASPDPGKSAVDLRSTQWAALEGSLERRIRQEWADALSRARTEADTVLAREPQPELLEHWKRLTDSWEPTGPRWRRRE